MPRTDFIDILSNDSSPIQNHPMNTTQSLYPTNTTIDTTLALIIPPPIISQTISTQEVMVSTLAPRALVFSTPPSSPLEPHLYLTNLSLPNAPIPTPMDFEPSFPPINPSKSRICAQPEPFLSRNKVMQQLRQFQDFDRHIEAAIQNVQNSLLHPFTTTSPQMPPPFYFITSSITTIPHFRTSLPPSSTFVPLDQSL
ncbi:hypothetical protein Tco_0428666 [Tanacetum coccineum]